MNNEQDYSTEFYYFIHEICDDRDPKTFRATQKALLAFSRALADLVVTTEWATEAVSGNNIFGIPDKYRPLIDRLSAPESYTKDDLEYELHILAREDVMIPLEVEAFSTALECGACHTGPIETLPEYFGDASKFVDTDDLKRRYPKMRRAFFERERTRRQLVAATTETVHQGDDAEEWPDIIDG